MPVAEYDLARTSVDRTPVDERLASSSEAAIPQSHDRLVRRSTMERTLVLLPRDHPKQ